MHDDCRPGKRIGDGRRLLGPCLEPFGRVVTVAGPGKTDAQLREDVAVWPVRPHLDFRGDGQVSCRRLDTTKSRD